MGIDTTAGESPATTTAGATPATTAAADIQATTTEGGSVDRVRAEVRSWLAANWSPGLTLRQWWTRLAESGWGFPTWPAQRLPLSET